MQQRKTRSDKKFAPQMLVKLTTAVFFDETGSEVVIASPLSQFMATNMEVRHVKNESTSTTFPVLDFGLMGSVQVNLHMYRRNDRCR